MVLPAFRCLSACTLGYALLNGRVGAFLFRREITVGFPLFKKSERGGTMLRRVVGLKDDLFVVIKSEPLQAFNDRARRSFCGTLQVCVFNSEQKLPASLARIQPVK